MDSNTQIEDQRCVASAKMMLASCFNQLAMLDNGKTAKEHTRKAIFYYDQAISECARLKLSSPLWEALWERASIARRLAEYSHFPKSRLFSCQAFLLNHAALQLRAGRNDRAKIAHILKNLGNLHTSYALRSCRSRKRKELAKAQGYFQEAAELYEQVDELTNHSITLLGLAISKVQLALCSPKNSSLALANQAISELKFAANHIDEQEMPVYRSELARFLGIALVLSAYFSNSPDRQTTVVEADRVRGGSPEYFGGGIGRYPFCYGPSFSGAGMALGNARYPSF
ncbi:MAG: hypothetical protein R3D99_00020 [Altererythrobacter sp.]